MIKSLEQCLFITYYHVYFYFYFYHISYLSYLSHIILTQSCISLLHTLPLLISFFLSFFISSFIVISFFYLYQICSHMMGNLRLLFPFPPFLNPYSSLIFPFAPKYLHPVSCPLVRNTRSCNIGNCAPSDGDYLVIIELR